MSEKNERKTGAILSYLSLIINTLVQLIYTPFLIKYLGQSEYGLYSLISSVIGYLTVLDLGFGNAIVVYTSKYRAQKKYDEEKKLHGMFKIIFIIIGCIASILGIILFFNVDLLFGSTMTLNEIYKAKIMMLLLSINLFFTFAFSIYSSIITAYEKFNFQKILSIISTLLKPLCMIPLLLLGFKSITMTLVISLINIVVLISNYLYCKKNLNVSIKFLGFDKKLFRIIFSYSFFIFLGVIVDKINWSVDQFILGAISGTIAVSVYSVASQINTLFINLSTAISNVFLPKMSMLIANKAGNEELTDNFIKIGRIQYYIIFLACTGFILLGKNFIKLWAGESFEESYIVSLILIIPSCFPLIQNLGLSIMQAMNKYKFKAISTFVMAIFNVIISVFLAQKYGAIGTAIGTAIALVICNIIIINVYYYKEIKLNVLKFWQEILKMSISFIIPLSITILFMKITNFKGISDIIVVGSFYTIIFSIFSYFFVMNDYEKSLIDKVLIKFKRR